MAIVVPDKHELEKWAKKVGITYENYKELAKKEEVKKLIMEEIKAQSKEAGVRNIYYLLISYSSLDLRFLENSLSQMRCFQWKIIYLLPPLNLKEMKLRSISFHRLSRCMEEPSSKEKKNEEQTIFISIISENPTTHFIYHSIYILFNCI